MNYAAVLCFLFEEREAVYFALRAMFARYWCRLNAVRSGPGMLLRLLKLFEVGVHTAVSARPARKKPPEILAEAGLLVRPNIIIALFFVTGCLCGCCHGAPPPPVIVIVTRCSLWVDR